MGVKKAYKTDEKSTSFSLVPTWLLGRLVAVLGRLGPSWKALETRLEEVQKMMPKKKVHKKSAKNASSGVFGRFGGGGSKDVRGRGHARAVGSGALNYHLPTKKTTQQRQRRKTKDER